MTRFSQERTIKDRISGFHFSLIIFIVLFLLFLKALSNISGDTLDRQEESLNTAINRSIVSCYCVEGTYPPNLQYMIDHYGLTYDEDLFFVDYCAFGTNIYPDVTVIRKEED